MASLREDIEASIASVATPQLATRLLEEYDELTRRFRAADYRPTELAGGRFAEAAFRVCQHACSGSHDPLTKPLTRVDKLVASLEQTPGASADDTFRIHIPRALRLLYDFRSKRDVAHLGTGVSPNKADALLVLNTAAWIMSDVVRSCHQCSIDTAQSIVDSLVERHTPLVWEEAGIVRVLDPSMSYSDQVLLLLYHFQPNWVTDGDLFRWVEYSRKSAFCSRVLQQLHDDAYIHYKEGNCKILPPGMRHVETSVLVAVFG